MKQEAYLFEFFTIVTDRPPRNSLHTSLWSALLKPE